MNEKSTLRKVTNDYFTNTKSNKGITLIALVVTIVVLLILAGVSIMMVIGNNGILNQASTAKIKTEYSTITEHMKLKISDYYIAKETANYEKTLLEYLQEQQIIDSNNIINVVKLVGTKLSTGNGTGTNDVYKLEEVTEIATLATTQSIEIAKIENKSYKIVYYTIKGELVDVGNIIDNPIDSSESSIDWDTIASNLENEEKRNIYLNQAINKGQSNTNKDVGIGTDGKVVNLDLWNYSVINSGTGIGLYKEYGSGYCSGYNNSNITEDGKIQGTVPQYIYVYNEDAVYPVTSMAYTFYYCTNLVTAPEIPDSVISMEYTFKGCTSLTGTIVIDANPEYYLECFTNTTQPIKLTGLSTKLNGLASTANNGNVGLLD